MAKKITGYIKLQVPAGAANPAPPIGPALGQRGVNIMEFCKAFNAATQELEKGAPIPTVITVFADRSFSFTTKTPPASFLLKKAARIQKGSSETGKVTAGTIRRSQLREIAEGAKADEAKAAGADVVGAEDLMETIQGGQIDFDRVIATPDMMGVVGRLGKVLGPKGLMPNPKLGTVTMDVTKAVTDAKSGQVEFRVEKAGIVHAGIGKASFSEGDLKENFTAFMDAIIRAKPSGAKGKFVKKLSVSSTMGPGVKIDLEEVQGG